MKDKITRRDLLKGAAATVSYMAVEGIPVQGADAVPPAGKAPASAVQVAPPATGSIVPLNATSDVYIPPRGRSFLKFSFDFPEPSVAFRDLLLGFRICTFENVYGLDREQMKVTPEGGGLHIECSGLVGYGGQEKVPGRLSCHVQANGEFTEWEASAEMDRPIKSVSTIVRGVPRGTIAPGTAGFFDPRDNEILFGYPWGAARQARGTDTPLAVIEAGPGDYFFLSSLLSQVRANRFYFQPGENGYRVELVYEREGWNHSNRIEGAKWRVGRTKTADEAYRLHYTHVQQAFDVPDWGARRDVPEWFRKIQLVVSIHGMHWTGYIFNDFAKALRILEWTSKQIPGENVMVFLPAWNGRYYWNYPIYKVDDKLGGEAGFRHLIQEGHRMGFRFLPMFGMNSANTELAMYSQVADANSHEIDGNTFNLAWVDWDNDRHNEGSFRYMNLGVASWQRWMNDSVADVIDRYGVDGYFLDISGGWLNNKEADMHEGTRQLVEGLRLKYPHVLAVGEFSYDALMSILPVYQVFPARIYPPAFQKYCRTFSHLSHPAPGRGSSGVHESGFGHFDPKTLSLTPFEIPTITVVDDTFDRYRDVMAEIIAKARQRAGKVQETATT